jgi:hypothetical protein
MILASTSITSGLDALVVPNICMLRAPIRSALSSSLWLSSEEGDAEGLGDCVVNGVGVTTGEGVGGDDGFGFGEEEGVGVEIGNSSIHPLNIVAITSATITNQVPCFLFTVNSFCDHSSRDLKLVRV